MIGERELKYIAAGRRKARTNLFWLCKHVLDFTKVVPHVHGPIIEHLQGFRGCQGTDIVTNEKFEYTPLDDDPANVLTGPRKRLLLAPRGWYKTSVNIEAHIVQWILNFPDITILLVHASQEIAEQILSNIKRHFQQNSRMRYLFPEFCPPEKKEWGTQQFFDIPARRHYTKSPTVQVSGIETIRTGMHYHVLKFTDIVDEKNTATREQCEKIIYRYGMARSLLISPRYWIDIEGTRYHYSDLYGRIIDEWMKEEEQGREHAFQVFIMPCYKRDIENERFTPDELDKPFLYDAKGKPISRFPEEFPTEELEKMRTDPVVGEEVFATQYLNNPITGESQAFDIKDLRWKTPEEIARIPIQYAVTTVDLAETTGKRSDNTVITTCLVDRMNRRYVVDIRIGKFLPDAIVDHLFLVHLKYRPLKIKIEETGFTRGLLPSVRRRSQITGIWPNFEFLKRDNQASKVERILGLQPWYKNGMLYFSTELPIHVKEELKHELTRFPKYIHDDILDTLADQFQGETNFGPVKESPSMKELLRTAQQKMLDNLDKYELIFGKKETTGSWSGLGAL